MVALDVGDGHLKLEGVRVLDTILLALAAGTSYVQSLQNKAAKTREGERGRYRGGTIPFGFRIRDDGYLEPDEAQQSLIVQLRAMRSRCATFRAMAIASEARGFTLTPAGIRKILERTS